MKREPPFVRSPYNYDTNAAGDESALKCDDETLAQQHFADDCDINTIVNKFLKTGQVPTTLQIPAYNDYEGIFDFQTAMNTIRAAQENFDAMPAKIRARFDNNPQKFLEFCHDPENAAEAAKLGLTVPKPPPAAPNAASGPQDLPEPPKKGENPPNPQPTPPAKA